MVMEPALTKHVDAEAPHAGNSVGKIDFIVLLKSLLVAVGHHRVADFFYNLKVTAAAHL